MLKATSDVESKYNLIKEFLLDTMKGTPNTQALSTWLFLTASRIHEALPWYYKSQNPKTPDKIYKSALLLDEIKIIEVSKGSGVYLIHVPHVLKRIGHSLKRKDEGKGRWIPTDDKDLLRVIFNYFDNQRPDYRGELLSRTFFNPKYLGYIEALYYIAHQKKDLLKGRILKEFLFRYQRSFTLYERFISTDRYTWLMKTKKYNIPIMWLLAFPMNDRRAREAWKKYGYYIEGTLYDTLTGELRQGKRPVYSHFFREARVNTLLYEYEYTLEEITTVLGWRDSGSIDYYLRSKEKMMHSAVTKMMNKALNLGQDKPQKVAAVNTSGMETESTAVSEEEAKEDLEKVAVLEDLIKTNNPKTSDDLDEMIEKLKGNFLERTIKALGELDERGMPKINITLEDLQKDIEKKKEESQNKK